MADYPALYLYTDAFIADTQHLSNEETGIYIRLICFAWRTPNCVLPDDDKRLANMVGMTFPAWKKKRGTIMGFWTKENGYWFQKKLRSVRETAKLRSKKASKAAERRWVFAHDKSLKENNTGDANASAEHDASISLDDANHNHNQKKKNKGGWTPVESTVEWAIGKGFTRDQVLSMADDCVAKMKLNKSSVDMDKAFFSWVGIAHRDLERDRKSDSGSGDGLLRSLAKDEEPGERG